MNSEKQKALDRLARLIKGKCPIHALEMSAVVRDDDLKLTYYCCPRPDCPVTANRCTGGTFELFEEFGYLLANGEQN